jgi:hypothetical protein
VKLYGPSAAGCEGDSLDAQLLLRDGGAAGVARFPVPWSTPDSWNAVARKAAVLEFVLDEDAGRFVVRHVDLSGVAS